MTMDAFELKRRFKLQAKALAKLIDFGPEPEGLVNRASGNAVCEICGLEYYDHPHDDELSAVVTCDGRLLHL
jgi:hypothetical protein